MKLLKKMSFLAAAAMALAASGTVHAAYTWGNVALGGGGFVSAVIPSKTEAGVVYARTDVGGAYRYDKINARWQPLLDWVSEDETSYLGVDSLAIDPKNAANIYLLAGTSYFNNGKTAILRSTNYGRTFAITDVTAQFKTNGNGMGRQNGEKLAVDPGSSNVLYVGTRSNGLFKSADFGATWSRMAALNVTTTPNEAGISFVLPDPASVSGGVAQRMFVGISRAGERIQSFYRTDNAGATFTAVSGAPTTLMPQRAALDGAGNLYITYANGAGPHGHSALPEPMDKGQVWKYNTSSGAWTNVTPAGITNAFSGINVDPTNPQRIIASTINMYQPQGDGYGDHFFISSNGGASWTDVVTRGFAKDNAGLTWINGKAIHWSGSIEFDPFNTKSVYVTSGNGIFKTADIDATTTTWTFDVKGLEETVAQNVVSIAGGPVISTMLDYDGAKQADVTQYVPIHTPSMGSTSGLAVAAGDTSRVVRVGSSMYYSTDTGSTWLKSPIVNGSMGQVALSAYGGVLLHSPKDSTTSYRSPDMGANWTAISGLATANLRPVADSVNSSKFYAYDNGVMRVSIDGGATFAARATLAAGGSNVVRVAPGIEGDVWVPLHGGGLARSTNSGTSFTTLANVTNCAAVGFGKADIGATYPTIFIWGTVNGVRGLHRSTNTGATWLRINDDAHEYGGLANGQFVVGDMNTFGVVYMSTAGRGIVWGKP